MSFQRSLPAVKLDISHLIQAEDNTCSFSLVLWKQGQGASCIFVVIQSQLLPLSQPALAFSTSLLQPAGHPAHLPLAYRHIPGLVPGPTTGVGCSHFYRVVKFNYRTNKVAQRPLCNGSCWGFSSLRQTDTPTRMCAPSTRDLEPFGWPWAPSEHRGLKQAIQALASVSPPQPHVSAQASRLLGGASVPVWTRSNSPSGN